MLILHEPPSARPGMAHRVAGSTLPGEYVRRTSVVARDELVTLSIRSWPRDDLTRDVGRILDSFEIIGA
jgi:hypothetical protein